MKERPILFSGPMVRAILEGRKTQTRRICTHRHGIGFLGGHGEANDPSCWGYSFDGPDHHGYMVLARGLNERHDHGDVSIPSPYGEAGDRLWVKETWQPIWATEARPPRGYRSLEGWNIGYVATDGVQEWHNEVDGLTSRCKPSIYMPRAFSRITLEVTAIRVERLQVLTEADAIAEGISPKAMPTAVEVYADLWDEINGKKAPWKDNPFVWVVSFRRLEATELRRSA